MLEGSLSPYKPAGLISRELRIARMHVQDAKCCISRRLASLGPSQIGAGLERRHDGWYLHWFHLILLKGKRALAGSLKAQH